MIDLALLITSTPYIMKKHCFTLLLCCIGQLAFSQNQSDEESIKKVLIQEGATWRIGEVNGHANQWQSRPYNSVLISTANGKFLELDPNMMFNPPATSIGSGGFSIHSNHQFSIYPTNAWVKHDEVSISKEGIRNYTKEIRFLEKTQNQWKLVGQSVHAWNPNENSTSNDTISYVHTVDIQTGEIDILSSIKGHYEAPNWHPDNYLILNSKGKIYSFDLQTKAINLIPTGTARFNNNDHGISPDKKYLVISNHDPNFPSAKSYKSSIYLVPITGGEPKRITSEVPSFWHGWSPDGKSLAYCAERNGNFDIYTISPSGGKEKRITTTEGLDDGPDYSADGKYIYFNSYRTGHMQIWRMLADGTSPEQLTFDENSNWFAHPSPDNKWIVYISYLSDEKQSHLFGKQVKLRLMNVSTKEVKDITPVFYGGQGSINVPSWSPDSKKIAFVSYSIK